MHINKALSAFATGCFLSFPAAATVTNIYILAGQSNMAGRGELTDANRIDMSRIIVWVQEGGGGHWEPAVEPLHHDNPNAGAGPGASFARAMADADPDVVIALIPGAVGGTSMYYQLADYCGRSAQSAKIASWTGPQVKGVLWHQGCSDSDTQANVDAYSNNLQRVIKTYRDNWPTIPIVVGELGRYLVTNNTCPYWFQINQKMHDVVACTPYTAIVTSEGLTPKADNLHFDTPSARTLGTRYATAMQALQAPGAAENDTRVTPAPVVDPGPEGGDDDVDDPSVGSGPGGGSEVVEPVGDYTVDPENGTDTTDGGNTVFKTIKYALMTGVSSGNKRVVLKKGHYLLDEPICTRNNWTYSLIGENPANPRDVLIDGQGNVTCVAVTQGTLRLANLCVTNGVGGGYIHQSAYVTAGGISMVCGSVTNCIVTDCHIRTSTISAQGAGIWIRNASSEVVNTLVENCSIKSTGNAANHYFYGGGFYTDAAMLKHVVIRNCTNDDTSATVNGHVYGGGAYCATIKPIYGCVFTNNVASGRDDVLGGGAYSQYSSFTNCQFSGNVARHGGGGLYLKGMFYKNSQSNPSQRPEVVACTFSDNEVTMSSTVGGAGIVVSGYGWMENCLVMNNHVTGGAVNANGYGGAVMFYGASVNTCDPAEVVKPLPYGMANCVVRGNTATGPSYGFYGSVGFLLSPAWSSVSNCVIECNSGSYRGGIAACRQYGPVTITDTLVRNETNGAFHVASENATLGWGRSVVRNCMFVSGEGKGDVVTSSLLANTSVPSVSPTISFENCTIAGNNAQQNGGNAVAAFGCGQNVKYAPLVSAKGLLFYDNVCSTGYPDFSYWFTNNRDVFSYTYYGAGNNVVPSTDASLHNVQLTATPFADGSYALKSKTQARDAMATADAPAWMKTAQAQDLGDGTYSTEKVLDYGVKVVFNNRHNRLIGDQFDIGASEFKPKPGLMMLIR